MSDPNETNAKGTKRTTSIGVVLAAIMVLGAGATLFAIQSCASNPSSDAAVPTSGVPTSGSSAAPPPSTATPIPPT